MKNRKILMILPVTMLLISSRMAASPADAITNPIQDTVSQNNTLERETEPRETSFPTDTVLPQNTLQPAQTPAATPTVKPATSTVPLKKVASIRLVRYSTKAVKVTWIKNKKARYYRVYYSKNKPSGYKCYGITKENHLLVDKLENNTDYYFYVQACSKKKKSSQDSKASRTVHIRTKTYSRKTIFAGDSITYGMGCAFPAMHIGGIKKIVAARGLKTNTFYTQRIFHGQTGLQKLISEKPYRIYLMLGMNSILGTQQKDIIADFKHIIQSVQDACPKTSIVLCAIPPVSRAKKAFQPGFRKVPEVNRKMKKLAKQTGTDYFNYTGFLTDPEGYLKTKYSAGDGYHWNKAAYAKFSEKVEKYDKALDR